MTLAPGTRLGPYEIVAALGAGGMGEVYRARDTRLGRVVAIKVLGDRFRNHPEYRARFEHEARAVAELGHPNIASLHDVGHSAGVEFLVFELVEGETLANRLRKGPLPFDSVCRLGAQVANALAAAHTRGIVHRDLKPSNIMVTATGAKLLDFGLARRFEVSGDAAATDASRGLTATGVIPGTVPYLAPEQVEGRGIDARTDVFALGAVLWEMATGPRAFDAPTDAALMAAILTADPPPIASLRPGTPSALDRLVRECLRKDPAQRWQSARDAALVLEGIARDTAQEPAGEWPKRRWLQWATLATAAAAIVLWLRQVTTPSAEGAGNAASVRFVLQPPEDGGFAYSVETNFLSVSPNGRRIAYTAYDAGGTRIWMRELEAASAVPLRGTEGAFGHAWSPDGRSLAFFANGRLQRMEVPDGAPVTVAETPSRSGHYISWGAKGSILFAGVQGEAIYRVPDGGGTPEAIILADTARGAWRVQFPVWLPDGERFMYLSRGAGDEGVLLLAGTAGAADTIMRAESWVQYADPGVLAFVRNGSLLAQRFDPRTGRTTGNPVGVADSVRYFLSTGAAGFATSAGATLAYQTGDDRERLAWFDRTGRETGRVDAEAGYLNLAISPDGRQLLLDREDPEIGTWDVHLLDFERGVGSPLTTSRATEAFGTWVPGENAIIYSISRGLPPFMVRRDLTSGMEARLLQEPGFQQPTHVSADGRFLLFNRRESGGSFDIWWMALEGEGPSSPLVRTPGDDVDGRFSPDGRYVAYLSDETGARELYVTPFPGPGTSLRISPDGAAVVRWAASTGELIWLTPDRRVAAARVRTDPLNIAAPTTLFALPPGMVWTNFDAGPDGQRLLATIPTSVAARQPVTVITDWTARLGG